MISVITWDAGFRESYHTVDFFSRQTLDKSQFEFIWADYYSTIEPELEYRIQAMGNGHIFCFGGEGKWHLGRSLNAAIQACKGDLLVIPDGDIAVDEDFLEEVARCHSKNPELVLYFRRWDEPKPKETNTNPDLSRLIKNCRLNNPTNYGGCLTLSKKAFIYVKGYEENQLFSEAGAIGMELYTRLKNAGFPIMWHPTYKSYHPWHEGTSPKDPEYLRQLELQMMLIKKRDLNVEYLADSQAVDQILQAHIKIAPKQKKASFLNKLKTILWN